MADLTKLTPEQFVAWCMAKLEERGFDTQKGSEPPVLLREDTKTISFSDDAMRELKKVSAFKTWVKPFAAQMKAQADHERTAHRIVMTFGIDIDIMTNVTPDNRDAQILANLQALGINTEKYPVHIVREGERGHDRRYPITVETDGKWSIEADALKELTQTPSPLTEYWDRKVEKAMEMMYGSEVARMTGVDPELQAKLNKTNAKLAATKRTPDGEIITYIDVEWTAPEFKDLGFTTAAQFMAWVRAKLDEVKFKREPWSVDRKQGDMVGIEMNAYLAIADVPEIRARMIRTNREYKEHHLATDLAPLTQFEIVVPELEDCVAALATDQELDPDHAGDTELTALIASVGQTCQELRQGVQQLKHITLPGRARWEGACTWSGNPRPYAEGFMRYYHCLEGLEAALERNAMQSYRDGTWQEELEAREACRAAYQKLHDAETPMRTGLRHR